MSEQEILHELKALNQKIDRLFSLLNSIQAQNQSKRTSRKSKPKPAPLTPEEMEQHQTRFGELYEKWLSGHEIEVQQELDKLDVEGLRRFADSNNLNVTSKMPRERILHLISARFREKKQLHRVGASRTEGS